MADTVEDQEVRDRREAEKAREEHDRKTKEWLSAKEFVVVAPYVTLKVKDRIGAFVIQGLHEGGRVERDDVEPDSLRHHVDSRLIAPDGSDEAKQAGPAGTPKPAEPPNVPVSEQPPASLSLDERMRRNVEAAKTADEAGAGSRRPAKAAGIKADSGS